MSWRKPEPDRDAKSKASAACCCSGLILAIISSGSKEERLPIILFSAACGANRPKVRKAAQVHRSPQGLNRRYVITRVSPFGNLPPVPCRYAQADGRGNSATLSLWLQEDLAYRLTVVQ